MRTALIPILGLVLLQSCSWYRNLERSLVEDDEKQAKKNRPVSREQYDNLLVKYEELSKKYQQLKEGKGGEKSALVEELQRTSGENFSATPTGNADTVDAFGGAGAQVVAAAVPLNVPADVESQLTLYKKGVSLKTSNPGEATKIFQGLESEGIEPVKVRSKLQIGELLYAKGQFDLALQVFEDIINKYSSSGVTLDALRYAALCSEKLGQPNKKEQYTSMLRDVFEAQ